MNSSMIHFTRGEKYPLDYQTGVSGAAMQYVCGTPLLIMFVPYTEGLLAAADTYANGLKLSIMPYRSVLDIAIKIGKLEWVDAPYTPHRTDPLDLPRETSCPAGEGLLTTYVLVNSMTGIIEDMRLFTLSNHFSNTLLRETKNLLRKSFSEREYMLDVQTMWQRYTPREIGEELKVDYYNLRGER